MTVEARLKCSHLLWSYWFSAVVERVQRPTGMLVGDRRCRVTLKSASLIWRAR